MFLSFIMLNFYFSLVLSVFSSSLDAALAVLYGLTAVNRWTRGELSETVR